MTQEERWMVRYNEVKGFIETNHRNPSKYNPEEMLMVHFRIMRVIGNRRDWLLFTVRSFIVRNV